MSKQKKASPATCTTKGCLGRPYKPLSFQKPNTAGICTGCMAKKKARDA